MTTADFKFNTMSVVFAVSPVFRIWSGPSQLAQEREQIIFISPWLSIKWFNFLVECFVKLIYRFTRLQGMVSFKGLVVGCWREKGVEEEEVEEELERWVGKRRKKIDFWLRFLSSCLFPNFICLHPSLPLQQDS